MDAHTGRRFSGSLLKLNNLSAVAGSGRGLGAGGDFMASLGSRMRCDRMTMGCWGRSIEQLEKAFLQIFANAFCRLLAELLVCFFM